MPVPLTQLPPHCGHTTPTYGGLVYATPYDGCGVAQQVLLSPFHLAWAQSNVDQPGCSLCLSGRELCDANTVAGKLCSHFLSYDLYNCKGNLPGTSSSWVSAHSAAPLFSWYTKSRSTCNATSIWYCDTETTTSWVPSSVSARVLVFPPLSLSWKGLSHS